jgi:hypothetical protein
MKLKFKIHLFLIALFFLISCNSKSDVNTKLIAPSPELVETLKAIVKKENSDFYKKDLKAWSNHFLHSEAVYWICVEDDVTLRATGWKDLYQFVSKWMKENPTPQSDTLLKQDTIEDFHVELSNEIAFVSYKNNHMMPDGKAKVFLENRIFKLIDNEWKILSITSAPGYSTPKSTSNVFIHNDVQK